MKLKHATRLALVLSGKYDVPGKSVVVSGSDAYGRPVSETIPEIDTARLEADALEIMNKLKGK